MFIKILDSGDEAILEAAGQMDNSRGSFNGMTGKIKELQPKLAADFNEASNFFHKSVADVRTKAYAGAASGVVFGPIGLAIAYSIAAGIVEGELVPNLKRSFKETQAAFDKLETDLEKSGDGIEAAKSKINKEIDDLRINIKPKLNTTDGLAEAWALDPPRFFDSLKSNASDLIKLCTDYS